MFCWDVTWASDRSHHQLTISQWWSVTHMWSEYLGNDTIAWRENRYLEKSYQSRGWWLQWSAGGGYAGRDGRHCVSCSIIWVLRAEQCSVISVIRVGGLTGLRVICLLWLLMLTPGHNDPDIIHRNHYIFVKFNRILYCYFSSLGAHS